MRFAYADPPYLGKGRSMYGHPEWDQPDTHLNLLAGMADFDGWAISTHVPGLRLYRSACDPDVRICAWVKGFASWKPNVAPTYAWEPVLLKPVRGRERLGPTVRDWVKADITTGRTVKGAKPDKFCHWLFDAAGLTPEDQFLDLFPGSGAVTAAWEAWCRQRPFADYAARLKS